MDPEMKAQLDRIEQIAEAACVSAEKTRKYILWTVIISVAVVVIPLLILPFAAMSLLSTYSSALNF
ncbi:MAG: hypothetical protein ACREGH_00850 [Minisyncoccia bacterium]